MKRTVAPAHKFGGHWTDEKLECVRTYLMRYAVALKRQRFEKIYVDAFAGTGYRNERCSPDEPVFRELLEGEGKEFIDGSARIALGIPEFSRYIFIDSDPRHTAALEKLRKDYPILAPRISICQADANEAIRGLCQQTWSRRRAVVFLDPYGMQVEWATIRAIASTEAVDMWLLFPLGVAINRLLRNDGQISESIRERLDRMFGCGEWYDAFYSTTEPQPTLFGDIEPERIVRTATFKTIGDFFVSRLKTIFPAVAPNPKPLCNSKNIPLYLLCFAAANKKGGDIAVRIAQHILK